MNFFKSCPGCSKLYLCGDICTCGYPTHVSCPEKSPVSEQPTEWDDETDPDFNGQPPSELPPSVIRAALMPEKVYL